MASTPSPPVSQAPDQHSVAPDRVSIVPARRVFLTVIDGLGCGPQEDSAAYGDADADTLRHVVEATGVELPNFKRLGLGNVYSEAVRGKHVQKADSHGNIAEMASFPLPAVDSPLASVGIMREVSAGKDSTTGHWEMAGIPLPRPFPVYPDGFPESVIHAFCRAVGVSGVLSNAPASGSEVIQVYGAQHLATGHPIVYTSADSVFQVACHVDVVPLETLYEWCRIARDQICVGAHQVGRVIARPFTGDAESGFVRLSDKRKDFAVEPPVPNLLSVLQDNGVRTTSIGKVTDLFAHRHFDRAMKTGSNREGLDAMLRVMGEGDIEGPSRELIFTNLIDTDQLFGHRQDPVGFAGALKEIDEAIPHLLEAMRPGDHLFLTGDHGNDPTDNSTDHSREFVPLLHLAKDSQGNFMPARNLGVRATFSDVAASVLGVFGVSNPTLPGSSFIE